MRTTVFRQMQQLDHEQIVFCHDKHSGLKAIIAIHNTTLGPALGGTRLWNYNSEEEAITDALRLSRGMTYKAAISGLNLGGGKAVIIGDTSIKSEGLWRRYGKFVDSLKGKYITAEDVNTTARDMEYIATETEYVTGVPQYMGGSGDPSPFTAYGVFMGMKACAKKAFGTDDVNGKRILVQGVGNVGRHLVENLLEHGARVLVADVDEKKIKRVTQSYPNVQVVDNDKVFDQQMDIYAPCALGAVLTNSSIEKLTARVVAGAANNQLADEEVDGPLLLKKGIVYAPDFLINAGGLINVSSELGGYNAELVKANIEKIYSRTLEILDEAEKTGASTQATAIEMAERRIRDIAILKSRS